MNLVVDNAVAGFVDGYPREGISLVGGGGCHGIDDGIDALLTEFGELQPSLFGAAGERSRLRNRSKVAISLRCGFRHRCRRAPPRPSTQFPFGRMRSTSVCGRGITCT